MERKKAATKYQQKIRWYLASLELSIEAALSGFRHQHPKADPWKMLQRRWRREDQEHAKANAYVVKTLLRRG